MFPRGATRTPGPAKRKTVFKRIKKVLLFDTSLTDDLPVVRARILEDNRRFAADWSAAQFFYAAFCLFLSFYRERFTLCRDVYVAAMVVSALAFFLAVFVAKKKPLAVYLPMFLNDLSLLGSGLLIARILLRNGDMTIMLFASVLIAPILFVNNTLLNILVILADFFSAAFLLREGLPEGVYEWAITTLAIISSMGLIIGYFVNKARYERYVFAESAVQLAESSAKIAELQTKYAYYDQMTALRNRRAYSEKFEAFEKEPPSSGWCLVMIDVNGLKQTNDEFGHAAGDELIAGVADCMRGAFGEVETLYRLGGDEFCVITTSSEKETGASLKRFETLCSEWKGQYVSGISVSYGFASSLEFPAPGDLVRAADRRMYAFKKEYYLSRGIDRRKN